MGMLKSGMASNERRYETTVSSTRSPVPRILFVVARDQTVCGASPPYGLPRTARRYTGSSLPSDDPSGSLLLRLLTLVLRPLICHPFRVRLDTAKR